MRAGGAARLGTWAERLVDDGLDGAGAATAVGAATKTDIKLLGISRHRPAGAHGIADVVVAEDVTGTNDHLKGVYIHEDARPSSIGC